MSLDLKLNNFLLKYNSIKKDKLFFKNKSFLNIFFSKINLNKFYIDISGLILLLSKKLNNEIISPGEL